MSEAISKGSRFRVLSGMFRGQICTVIDNAPDGAGCVGLDLGNDLPWYVSVANLAGPMFQRLADAPAEVSPLLTEIDAASRTVDLEAVGGAIGVIDEIRHSIEAESDPYTDPGDWYANQRLIFAEVAAIAIAGLRAIDGRSS